MVPLTRQRHQTQDFIELLGEGAELEMTLIPAGIFVMGSPADKFCSVAVKQTHQSIAPQACVGGDGGVGVIKM